MGIQAHAGIQHKSGDAHHGMRDWSPDPSEEKRETQESRRLQERVRRDLTRQGPIGLAANGQQTAKRQLSDAARQDDWCAVSLTWLRPFALRGFVFSCLVPCPASACPSWLCSFPCPASANFALRGMIFFFPFLLFGSVPTTQRPVEAGGP